MNQNNNKIQVILFSGGRGNASIIEALLNVSAISLTIIVNAYDDGLSTGEIRSFIPGMLGPSDIRKNISHLIPDKDISQKALKALLEYRLPMNIKFEKGLKAIEEIAVKSTSNEIPEIESLLINITLKQSQWLKELLNIFIKYLKEQKKNSKKFNFSDCSLGNILFAGCFLKNHHDFNKTVKELSQLSEIQANIENITNGQNLVLTALKNNNQYLKRESAIVAPQNAEKIKDIFLLKDYLTITQLQELEKKSLKDKIKYLQEIEILPKINPHIKKLLETADVIIYGPGTQHSSLYPSYLTNEVAETIMKNRLAEKIFISNIERDHDIPKENVNTLIKKFLYYMSRKGALKINPENIVTKFFIQKPENIKSKENNYIPFHEEKFKFPKEKINLLDWEDQKGKHGGGQIVDELLSIVSQKLQIKLKPYHYSVSIIVPGLNEEKTIKKTLHSLNLLNFTPQNLGKEIIYIDGGSRDKTLALAKSEPNIRIYQLQKQKGRSSALRLGIEKAKGNIIIFFPANDEYDTKDLYNVISPIANGEYQAVFGSRAIKCMNLTKRIKQIYKHQWLGYLASKYGGITLSILTLLLFNKYLSDTLTSIKAFDARLLKNLKLKAKKGFNLDMELIGKLGMKEAFILEVPVQYNPRTKKQGKKTTFLDGLMAINTLIKQRIFTKKP